MKTNWLRLCVVMGLLAGCGDDDDSDSEDSELAQSAPAYDECVQYADVVCSKGMSCGVELGELTNSEAKSEYDDCFRLTKKGLDCGKAIGTSPSYDQCISGVRALACEDRREAPAAVPENGRVAVALERDPPDVPAARE